MDYKFLSLKAIEKTFKESDMTVGEIIRTITQEKFSGIKIENRSVITETTDKEWCSIIEKAFDNERE